VRPPYTRLLLLLCDRRHAPLSARPSGAFSYSPSSSAPSQVCNQPLYSPHLDGIFYAGIALAVASLWALAFLVPTLVIVRYGVITREKAYLEREFGDDYRHFRTAVRRWL